MFANHTQLLRRAIAVDAIVGGVTGVLLVVAANLLGDLLALPVSLLRSIGLFLALFALCLGYVASRPIIPTNAAWGIIIFNAFWVVASVVLLFSGFINPNALGYAFVIAQALLVGGIAEAQYMGIRQLTRATMA